MEASTTTKTASVYICKNGHRTISLWSVPETCRHVACAPSARAACPSLPLDDAPADAKEKMLNPLKASKKAAKKK